MGSRRKIAILLHERDPYPDQKAHFIWALCEVWRASGIEIDVLKGSEAGGTADLLIPHIDLTVLPEAYTDTFSAYPRVANRNVRDISKRLISRNLVTKTDTYNGPVIVKTNLNYGGIPEASLLTQPDTLRKRKPWWKRVLHKLRNQPPAPDWAGMLSMEPHDYPVFPSVRELPPAIWTNRNLVVEGFLPEFENGLYHLRLYQFLGGRGYCVRLGSQNPVVKNQGVVSREVIDVPDEIVAIRRELGLDYGKMDFVVREGRVILLDVNRTPGLISPIERMQASALQLAPGLDDLF